jgi:hypothetical protein
MFEKSEHFDIYNNYEEIRIIQDDRRNCKVASNKTASKDKISALLEF